MVRPGHDPLSGAVEVDGTHVGCKVEGAKGRKLGIRQPLVVVAVERDGKRAGRTRLQRRARCLGHQLGRISVQAAVQAGSTVWTDGWAKLFATGGAWLPPRGHCDGREQGPARDCQSGRPPRSLATEELADGDESRGGQSATTLAIIWLNSRFASTAGSHDRRACCFVVFLSKRCR